MNEEEIKIFIDEYYKLKNIQNSIKEIDKDFFFNLVDKLLYLYNKEKEKNKKLEKDNKQLDILVKEKSKDIGYMVLNYISKNKIREKIEILDIAILSCEYSDDDTDEIKKIIEGERYLLLRDKYTLQKLLEE